MAPEDERGGRRKTVSDGAGSPARSASRQVVCNRVVCAPNDQPVQMPAQVTYGARGAKQRVTKRRRKTRQTRAESNNRCAVANNPSGTRHAAVRVAGRQGSEKIKSQGACVSFSVEGGTGEREGQQGARNANWGAVTLQLPECSTSSHDLLSSPRQTSTVEADLEGATVGAKLGGEAPRDSDFLPPGEGNTRD